jgi:RNase H-like domain found in reverse transcriptase
VLLGSGWNKKKPRNIPIQVLDFEEKWTATQRESFLDLRAALSDPEMMVPPRAGAKKRVVTDASKVGYGAVLLQQETNEEERPVEYIARKLKGGNRDTQQPKRRRVHLYGQFASRGTISTDISSKQ